MTARADLSTISGNLHCRVVTDKTSVDFVLEPLEAMALADAIKDYAIQLLHVHVSDSLDVITQPLNRRVKQSTHSTERI